ncbi:hypothetical protein DACRYDRAFT_19069 [Dacryopinax primogenitus]|uniref:Uncharacterized protein n=1 Tax=Dacryopinax primogenitus (strain DJM 731) TaxID=1858805 RepID=M5FQL6_DACPD|nr:uncharacterized protein DACRYDRAFT_19069 [Dacryopinax primogenitus]EJT97049.1 hypothetical protein DACRYDRAFT_19069 [Dacryopinax primogenitus]
MVRVTPPMRSSPVNNTIQGDINRPRQDILPSLDWRDHEMDQEMGFEELQEELDMSLNDTADYELHKSLQNGSQCTTVPRSHRDDPPHGNTIETDAWSAEHMIHSVTGSPRGVPSVKKRRMKLTMPVHQLKRQKMRFDVQNAENSGPVSGSGRSSLLSVQHDPQRQLLEWYHAEQDYDIPIWISFQAVHLKQKVVRYTAGMGAPGYHELDAVYVPPEQLSVSLIRRWGWVVTRWPNECSVTLSHGFYHCVACQATAHPSDKKKKATTSKKKKFGSPQDEHHDVIVVKRNPTVSDEGSVVPLYRLVEICIQVPEDACLACVQRGRPCLWCKEGLKNIPALTYAKPTDQWIEGDKPTSEQLFNRLAHLQHWAGARPPTKHQKWRLNRAERPMGDHERNRQGKRGKEGEADEGDNGQDGGGRGRDGTEGSEDEGSNE